MELMLTRRQMLPDCTTGDLVMCQSDWACKTLEPHRIDWRREKKTPGKTAIPEGRYQIKMSWSNRYQKLMPFLQNVPQFEGVMIHPGNTVEDTKGCILIGSSLMAGVLRESRKTFEPLYKSLMYAHAQREEIWIEITLVGG